jgi:uncharacterized protein YbjT (DUF2867 family)
MKIVVIGGSGLIGSKLAKKLTSLGHLVIAASPSSGVNTITGEGLEEVMKDTQVVVDVANSPSFEDKAVMEFFQTSGRNLMAAELASGVKHHVALSIVNTEKLPDSGYLRAKVAQEEIIKKSGIPYTIVHSTQFFEFAKGIADSATIGDEIHLSPALFQPIASDDVVAAMVKVATGPALNDTIEIGGPEKIPMDEFIRIYLRDRNDHRVILADKHAKYFGTELNDQSLVPADQSRLGKIRFAEWVKADLDASLVTAK